MTVLRDRYEVREKLGEGGMAEVYRAVQLTLDREVAVKFIRPALTQDDRFATRFAREARAIARLSHPNILHVHDFDQADDGRYFMVMELLEGSDLATRIDDMNRRDRLFPLDEVITITRSVAEALYYAHRHDVAHRDIKPGNIFLTNDGRVVVMDFGIAKLLSGEGQLTTTGTVIGTPHYFAPEQGSGQPVDYRVDIYALGAVFYEMLTGQVPYDADSTLAILAQHASAPIPDPCSLRPDLPPEITGIIRRAMAKDPEHRYPNMGALIADLDALAAREPLDGATLIVSAAETTEPVTPPGTLGLFPRGTTGAGARASRHWLLLAALSLVVLVVIGGLIVFFTTNKENGNKKSALDLEALHITPAAEGEYLVIVTDFVGDEQAGVDAARRIANQLRAGDLAVTLGDSYRLEQTDQQVTSREEADALAAATGALMVVWGVQDTAGLEVVVQAHGYPARTLNELRFLVPAGDDFGTLLTNDAPIASSIYTQSLIMQRLLYDDQFIPLLLLSQFQEVRTAGEKLGVTPGSLLDRYLLDIALDIGAGNYGAVDEIVTNALTIVPDDPTLYFMRWGVDAIYLGHLERAQPDAARLQELLPEAGMPYWISATTYFLAGDYAQLIVYTDNLKRDNPNAFYVTMLYREMTLLDQGDFKTVLSEIDGLETEANAAASIAGRMLVDFPALAPMRALVYEMTGNTAAAQADQEQVRVSRILETLANTANTMMSNMGPPVPMLVYSSYIMEVDYARTVARLSYDYALNSAPDYYLANWRRGVLAEEAGDYQDAYTYYARASGNAPVPFPIVSYLLARLIHTHGETLESPAEACNVLARAQADAETDPEFYALLLESIRALRADVACES